LEALFNTLQKNRKVLLQILRQTPREQLTRIPQGYNNNIWWNLAHVVVTQELLLYNLSGLPMGIPDSLVSRYRKGTYPQGEPSEEEISELEEFLLTTLDKAVEDHARGRFKEFREYTTSVGVTLRSFEDALAFNTFHEGLHLGVVMCLKKVMA